MRFISILFLGFFYLIACNSVDKEDASLFFLKGNVQLTAKNYEQAIHYYDESILKNPDFADAYLNRGLALLATDKTEEALSSLSNAIEKDDELFPAYLARAEVYNRLALWENVEKDLAEIQTLYADSSQFHLIRGNFMVGKNNFSNALAAYDRAITLNPGNVEALVNRGAVFFENKEFELAGKDFEQAVRLDPRQVQALNNLGLLASRQQNWSAALAYFDRALSVNAVDPFTLNNKGYVLLQTGKLDEAQTLINRSLSNKADNGYALRNLALYYQKKKDLIKAIEIYQKAIDLQQSVELLFGYAGEAYFLNGNKIEACRTWSTGVTLKDSLAINSLNKYCN